MNYCRYAPSLGELEGTPLQVWGTPEYEYDLNEPTVWFGLYGLPDFYSLWRHKGKKWVLWAGSDITHFKNGYWLDKEGKIRLDPKPLAEWLNANVECWVENEVERKALEEVGVISKVGPSFMGDKHDFGVHYKHSERPALYTSVSGDNFELYGWDKIPQLALENPDIDFHLYGNTVHPFEKEVTKGINLAVYPENIIIHGRVPKEQMNEEIKNMQGALRLTEFDGFSEILAKSILMGQYPVSLIEYPHMLKVSEIGELKNKKEPNHAGRNHYFINLNDYPWTK